MASPLTPAERQRIDAAISAIERGTSADLCVIGTHASDRYALYPIMFGTVSAILVGGVVGLVRPELARRTIILVELVVAVVLTLVLSWLPARLLIVPKRVKHARAQQLAHREFNAHALAAPSQPHRVLLFVSLGERYVEVIADHDTHALAPTGTWNKIVDEFLIAVKNGRVADGIVAAASASGAILKTHHPAPSAS